MKMYFFSMFFVLAVVGCESTAMEYGDDLEGKVAKQQDDMKDVSEKGDELSDIETRMSSSSPDLENDLAAYEEAWRNLEITVNSSISSNKELANKLLDNIEAARKRNAEMTIEELKRKDAAEIDRAERTVKARINAVQQNFKALKKTLAERGNYINIMKNNSSMGQTVETLKQFDSVDDKILEATENANGLVNIAVRQLEKGYF